MKLLDVSVFALLLVVPGSCSLAQEIRKAPAGMERLADKWDWGVAQAKEAGFKDGGWIAYSIERLMGEDSWIGSYRTFPEKGETSFYELITGVHVENPADKMREHGWSRNKRGEAEQKVKKEVAFLFRFSDPTSIEEHIRDIHPTNVNLSVDLEGLPLVWLGKATTEESLDLLKGLYRKGGSAKQKRRVVMAYGMHDSPNAFAMLKSVAQGDDQTEVRADAVFWIGQQNSPKALEFLTETARKEESRRVAEQAVFAISQIQSEEATETLIDLGKKGPTRDVRKRAVFWLGQQASRRAAESLKDFVYEGDDVEVQKQAIFALTQIQSEEGVTEIIKIAKSHPNPAVRKQAIFWLGESDDPRAFDAIVEIAKGK